MVKKIKLSVSNDVDYEIIGVSSHLKDYRLIYFINRELCLDFKKISDFIFFHPKKKEEITYSLFHQKKTDFGSKIYFLSNNSAEGKLLPAFKNSDYFFLIRELQDQNRKSELITKLKATPNVLTAFEIPEEKKKSLDAILSEMELQVIEYQGSTKLK